MLREYRDPWGGSIRRRKPRHPGLQAALLAAAFATAPAAAGDFDCSLCELRHGIKLEYGAGEARLHFGVNTRRPGQEPTKRVRFGAGPEGDAGLARPWSLGIVLEAAEARHGLDRIEPVPQLLLDGRALFRAPGDCRVAIQYSTWRGAFEDNSTPDRAVQALVRWQF